LNTIDFGQYEWPPGEFSGHPQTYKWYLPSSPWMIFPPQKDHKGCSIPLSIYLGRTPFTPQTRSVNLPISGMGRKRSMNLPPWTRFFHSGGRGLWVIWAEISPANKKQVNATIMILKIFIG